MLNRLNTLLKLGNLLTALRLNKTRILIKVGNDQFVPQSRRPRELPSQRVENALRSRLASDEWASGDTLPTVADLAGEYDTSAATVAKVLRKLADEGLVEVVPRWGTFKV